MLALILGVKHIGGDMFVDIPQADTIFMKVFQLSTTFFLPIQVTTVIRLHE
jgi:hypothetical protein